MAKKRRNPAKAAPVPSESTGLTGMQWLALGSVAAVGVLLLSSGSQEAPESRLPEDLPRARISGLPMEIPSETPPVEAPPPTRPVKQNEEMVAPRGVEAPEVIVTRVVGEDRSYKNVLIYYMQSLPFIFGETDTQPTGEKDSDQAMISAAVIRRILSGNNITWNGQYDAPAAELLRTSLLGHGAHPVRAIPYSFEPDIAGNIYAIAVMVDKKAINPFAPEQSVA